MLERGSSVIVFCRNKVDDTTDVVDVTSTRGFTLQIRRLGGVMIVGKQICRM